MASGGRSEFIPQHCKYLNRLLLLVFIGFNVVDDRPETKYLNRYIVEEVCASGSEAWLRLGNELFEQKDVAALNVIKSDVVESATMRCSEMLKLWLQRQPDASWRLLTTAMKKIHINKLASDVEKLLASEKIATLDQQDLQEGQRTQHSV